MSKSTHVHLTTHLGLPPEAALIDERLGSSNEAAAPVRDLQRLCCFAGMRLLKEFERFAEDRGCRTFYLETFSFQAPALYRRFGYQAKLEIHGFPGGIVKYTMVRQLSG